MKSLNKKHIAVERESGICSPIEAAMQSKCPKCRTGEMFANRSSYFERQKTNSECPHCDFRFEVEPGYFYMARFINYLLNLGESFLACLAIYLVTQTENLYIYFIAAALTVMVLSVVNFRLARILLLYCLTPGISLSLGSPGLGRKK
jgi:uncharacterized protein (DUF983 family)